MPVILQVHLYSDGSIHFNATIPSIEGYFFILFPYTACAQCCRKRRDAIKRAQIGARPIGMVALTLCMMMITVSEAIKYYSI